MYTPKEATSFDFEQLRKDECKRLDENDLCQDSCDGCSLNRCNPIQEYKLFLSNLALLPEVEGTTGPDYSHRH